MFEFSTFVIILTGVSFTISYDDLWRSYDCTRGFRSMIKEKKFH
jgi:hypothetical protein